ncbi:hypothetical protein ACOME3_003153 [Neoechinorhynchus agilis]
MPRNKTKNLAKRAILKEDRFDFLRPQDKYGRRHFLTCDEAFPGIEDFNKTMMIYVTNDALYSDRFYAWKMDSYQANMESHQKLNYTISNDPNKTPIQRFNICQGCIYVVKISNVFYRAKVKLRVTSSGPIRVFLIDFGKEVDVMDDSVYSYPLLCQRDGKRAIRCKLNIPEPAPKDQFRAQVMIAEMAQSFVFKAKFLHIEVKFDVAAVVDMWRIPGENVRPEKLSLFKKEDFSESVNEIFDKYIKNEISYPDYEESQRKYCSKVWNGFPVESSNTSQNPLIRAKTENEISERAIKAIVNPSNSFNNCQSAETTIDEKVKREPELHNSSNHVSATEKKIDEKVKREPKQENSSNKISGKNTQVYIEPKSVHLKEHKELDTNEVNYFNRPYISCLTHEISYIDAKFPDVDVFFPKIFIYVVNVESHREFYFWLMCHFNDNWAFIRKMEEHFLNEANRKVAVRKNLELSSIYVVKNGRHFSRAVLEDLPDTSDKVMVYLVDFGRRVHVHTDLIFFCPKQFRSRQFMAYPSTLDTNRLSEFNGDERCLHRLLHGRVFEAQTMYLNVNSQILMVIKLLKVLNDGHTFKNESEGQSDEQ